MDAEAKADGEDVEEPQTEATSPGSPAMTTLGTDTKPDPAEDTEAAEKPIAEIPEVATDARFADKEIENVLVTGATGGVGR